MIEAMAVSNAIQSLAVKEVFVNNSAEDELKSHF